jgi:hypothetical protein
MALQGEEIKAKALAEMQADRERTEAARARAKAANQATTRAHEAMMEYKRLQEKVAAEQEAARLAYLENKDQLAEQRRQRENAIAAEKEARRKAMVHFSCYRWLQPSCSTCLLV